MFVFFIVFFVDCGSGWTILNLRASFLYYLYLISTSSLICMLSIYIFFIYAAFYPFFTVSFSSLSLFVLPPISDITTPTTTSSSFHLTLYSLVVNHGHNAHTHDFFPNLNHHHPLEIRRAPPFTPQKKVIKKKLGLSLCFNNTRLLFYGGISIFFLHNITHFSF